jgi:thiol-disulfide isomerase/thioredoxin
VTRTLVVAAVLCAAGVARADVVGETRGAIAGGRFDEAHQIVADARVAGDTPATLEALSWIARGELAAKKLDEALHDAAETRAAAVKLLATRTLDAEPRLPIALGAALEVTAQARAAKGERQEAVAQLQAERDRYAKTSIVTRLNKNLNLLTLEGKPAPPLEREPHFGAAVPTLASLAGKPVLLFFWAHWCPDCKATAPVIAQLKAEFAASGLVVIAPTQLYGAVAGGEEAAPAVEMAYIDDVRRTRYSALGDAPAPVSSANFKSYGASSVPTIVVVDRKGNVVLYHPGKMSYDELRPALVAAAKSKR